MTHSIPSFIKEQCLLRDHSPVRPIRCSPPPPLRHQKTTQRKRFHEIVSWAICMCPPASQKWGFHAFGVFLFQQNKTIRKTLRWFNSFSYFLALFQCRRCPRSYKTDSCCTSGSEPHFQNAFAQKPPKNASEAVEVPHGSHTVGGKVLKHRSLFALILPKWRQ